MSRTVVLIDDDEFISTLYRESLEKAGFTVFVADNATEALQVIVRQKPDVVLLDLVLPQYDGFEILKAIKNSPVTSAIPVVVLSNLTHDSDEGQARALGAADFLVKANLLPRELVARLNKLLSEDSGEFEGA